MKTFTPHPFIHPSAGPRQRTQRVPNIGCRCRHGFITLDVALAITLSTLGIVATFYKVQTEITQIFAKATGQYLYALQAGVNHYVQTHYDTLASGSPMPQVNNPLEPTVAELRALKFLLPTFADSSPLGLSFTTQLKRENCPGLACSITGLIYSKHPYHDKEGALRIDLLSQARLSAGADAALSTPAHGDQLVGLDHKWRQANPLGAVPGTLAARVGVVAGNLTWQLAQFYKLDGSRQLSGSMNAAGQEIRNAKVVATERIQADDILVQNQLITRKLQLTRFKEAGEECHEGHGAMAIDRSGFILTCQGGAWCSSTSRKFKGWQNYPYSGCVHDSGFLLATSHFNTHMTGYTSGVLRFEDSRRDKYGQGKNSALMPIMQGECFIIHGAEKVWFMAM
ncbi:hypothetical protein [Mycoavidus sp. B2-EB]|uniref:hypothetical protein n=1 Tax=Mycoavidus sp. B2-EB TaxID=2651972 RepID=UPI00162A9897|nr:hypothetical protein [Mycoavidus sp. B2-EB]BBO59932.1 hypothetical protein MPB2EB_1062 [Mycoavidus sp. B2-EB]